MKNFEIIRSVDAPKHVSPKDVRTWTERTIAPISQAAASMPPILVMLVSESVGTVVGVKRTRVVRHSRSVSESPSYYEVWLVGQAGIADYVLALQAIINDFHTRSAPSVMEMGA